MTTSELKLILDNHKIWVLDNTKGTRAYLTGADLTGAYLTGAYLRGADLTGAYLRGAYLRGADLTGAYLRGAYLRGADLRGADLRGAYLRGADLRGADLRGASGVLTFTLGKDFGFCFEHKGILYLQIGCIIKPLTDWNKDYKTTGKDNHYSKQETELYGSMVKLLYKQRKILFKDNK